MKLIRCHIENFGTLQNADYEFSEGLNQFCHENGYGKSTLAAFFKAMFFGLPSYKSSTTKFNDRMHYYPFNAGKFGGSLVFEMDGTKYRIERYFDKKSETGDTLAVYRNGKPYDGFHEEIGKAVFGLDKESFERTAFFTETDTELCATSAIGEKLNKFVEHTDSVGFQEAASALEQAKKDLKKRGGGGKIDLMQERITSLAREIDNLQKISDSLPASYQTLHSLQEEISALQEKIKAATGKGLVAEKWKQLELLNAKQDKLNEAANQIKTRYTGGMPTFEELSEAKKETENVNTLRQLKARYTFPESKLDKLQHYEHVFGHGMPKDEALSDAGAQADEIKRIEAKLSSASTGGDERLRRLEQRFAEGLPDEKKEREALGAVEEYKKLIKSTPVAGVAPVKKKNPLHLVLAIVAAVVALTGAGLMFVNLIAGGVLLGVGVLALGIVAFLYLKGQSAATQSAESVKTAAKLKELEGAVREFLVPYGYYTQNGIVFDFGTYQQDKQDYLTMRNTKRETLSRSAAMQQRCEDLRSQLQAFFKRYQIYEEDFQLALVTLKNDLASYKALQAEEKEFYDRQESSQREVEESLRKVKNIYEKYALHETPSLEHIDGMLSDLTELTRLEKEAATIEREAQAYRLENKLTQKPQAVETDAEPLNRQLSERQRELANLQRQIADAETDAQRLDDRRAQRERAQEELFNLQERHTIISAALALLTDADRKLKADYVAPVKTAYLKYAEPIEKALGERMNMDADFRISFEHGGEERSEKYLSAGQRSIYSLGLRLALIKTMYGEKPPFLVLDDPFATLDEGHFEKTAALIQTLAKDMQILYFCCHKSRTI